MAVRCRSLRERRAAAGTGTWRRIYKHWGNNAVIVLERLLERLPVESAEAIVGMTRIGSRDLASDLRAILSGASGREGALLSEQLGRASCRERVCNYVSISGVDG